jgi:hypothetical protein
VDADMQIHPETFNAISRALEGDKIVAGSTGGRLERWSFGIALTFAAIVPLLVLFSLDTGVVPFAVAKTLTLLADTMRVVQSART